MYLSAATPKSKPSIGFPTRKTSSNDLKARYSESLSPCNLGIGPDLQEAWGTRMADTAAVLSKNFRKRLRETFSSRNDSNSNS